MLSLDRQNALRERYRRRRPGWRPASERFAALVREHLSTDGRVLDLGCGRGGLVEQLDYPLAQVLGVDPDLASLRQHRLPLPRAVAASDALPCADGVFDVVYASWVLEHLAAPPGDLREIRRVLRRGGVFVAVTPNRRHPLIRLNRWLGRLSRLQRLLVARLYGRAGADTFPAHYRANTPQAVSALAREVGFEVATLDLVRDPTYLAFAPALLRPLAWVEEQLPAGWALHLVICLRAV